MPALNIANLKKTIYYLQRNGLQNTWNAAKERLEQSRGDDYRWQEPSQLELRAGREACAELLEEAEKTGRKAPHISILVPAYRTNPVFLQELVESVRMQTYPLWELLILDATEKNDDVVKKTLKEICIVKGIPLTEETAVRAEDGIQSASENMEGSMQGSSASMSEQQQDTTAWQDGRVRYISLPANDGISENTNWGVRMALGDYCGLLDHDDVLTVDALGSMAEAILEEREMGVVPRLLYSDEDKWNGEKEGYYEPHFKEDFNLNLLLSNNYICHFLVMETALLRQLKLRKEYDGAQDFDLVLRAAETILKDNQERIAKQDIPAGKREILEKENIVHIPRVLYHWRCHSGSTAENPRSKTYAYEAGKRAVQDYMDRQNITAHVEHTKHVGFYVPLYYEKEPVKSMEDPLVLQQCGDLGAVGGRVICKDRGTAHELHLQKGCIVGGRMDFDGRVYYYGLKPGYSGYMHRAALPQDAQAVDLRCICVSKEFRDLFSEITGVPYVTKPGTHIFDASTLPGDCDLKQLSLAFGRALRERGKRILWDPEMVEEI